ncbi:MAG: SPFH domain-containing protein [Candidatus Coatesbacteria bacterium]|nr:SPFH domain-containing protein [Candidatus Coatesbacteria bacterium]
MKKMVLVLVLLAVALGIVRLVILDKIPCGAVAVRRSQFGSSGGEAERVKVLLPGLRVVLPILHEVELVSTIVRKLDIEHVEITLEDNLRVFVDATTTFNVEPSDLALQFALNDGDRYIRSVMPNDLKGVVREVLQKTDADGFLDAAWRGRQKAAIEAKLSELLAKRGLKLGQFFLRDFAFAAPYEQELKYQRQTRQQKYRRSLEMKLASLESQGNVDTQALEAEIEEVRRNAQRTADAADQEAQMIAENARQQGDFLIHQAEVEGQGMMTEVLKSADANAMMRMEMIDALRTGLRFIILRPSDIGLLDALSGKEKRTR